MTGDSNNYYYSTYNKRNYDSRRNQGQAPASSARTGVKAYEVTTVIAAIADIISEEVLESNRISLADHTGTKMVSIYPKVNGSVSDADIERETTAAHTADPSVPVRTRAEESDLTTDRLNWVLGATIGVKLAFPFLRPVGSKRHPSGCRARAAELNLQQAVCTEQAGTKG